MGQTEISMITNRNLALTDAYNTVYLSRLWADFADILGGELAWHDSEGALINMVYGPWAASKLPRG